MSNQPAYTESWNQDCGNVMKTRRGINMASASIALALTFSLPVTPLLAGSFQMPTAESKQLMPKAELVAPGIWRIRLGKPEEFTPAFFRTAPVDQEHLKTLPEVGNLPLDAGEISFQVSSHGCAVRLPM